MFGWYTHNYRLLQVCPTFVAMAYNTALGFAASGLAIVLLKFRRNPVYSKLIWFLILVVLAIGLLTIAEYLIGRSLHVDQIFMREYIRAGIVIPTRMALVTAVCFVLLGVALADFSAPNHRYKISLLWFLGSCVMGLGEIALSGYFTGIMSAFYEWGKLTRMAVHTSVGFILCGLAIYFCAWNECKQQQYRPFR